MSDFLTPAVVNVIITLAAILFCVLAVLIYRLVEGKVKSSQFWKDYGEVVHYLDEFITDLVIKIAVAPGDLSAYEEEARLTGRDIRLVAALHAVDQWTNDHGIDIDENEIIIRVEATLARLKKYNEIPPVHGYNDTNGNGEVDDVEALFNADAPATAEQLAQVALGLPEDFNPQTGCVCIRCTAARSVLGREDVTPQE